jgi:hypothetical protein
VFFFILTLFCGNLGIKTKTPHNNVGIMKTPQNNVGMKTKSHQNSAGIMQNTTQCRNEKHNTIQELKRKYHTTM